VNQRNRFVFLAVVASLVVVIDQAVKRAIVAHFRNVENDPQTVIQGVFDLILTRNPGAAWGMLGNLKPDGLRVAVFVVISIGAVAMVLWLANRARPNQRLLVAALSLVLGGALGNLVDRIYAGRVVDFLDFYSRAGWMVKLLSCDPGQGCHWPAFNVADMCISTGVTLLVLESFLSKPKTADVAPSANPTPASANPPTEPGPAEPPPVPPLGGTNPADAG
jgi:signal peptidase II